MNNQIVLNSERFPLKFFNKNTSFRDGEIVSSAYVTFDDGVTSDDFNSLLTGGIQSIGIESDGKSIYYKSNLTARIESISESLQEGAMRVEMNIIF